MERLINWIRTNWNEESHLGKAKLGAVTALVFLLIASVMPDTKREPVSTPAQSKILQDAVQQAGETYSAYESRVADLEKSGDEARQQAADTDKSYEARVGELETANQSGAKETAEAYQGYEARISQLERERQALLSKMSEAGSLEDTSQEASTTYQKYEVRISELEREKRDLADQMNKLDAGGDAAREAVEAYRDSEAHVTELEQETQAGQEQSSTTYSTYETRIAELERQNKALTDQLAARDERISKLEQGSGAAEPAAMSTDTMELRLQLEAMRATLDQLLKKLAAQSDDAE